MSIKIYQGYRAPQSKLPNLVKRLHKVLFEQAYQYFCYQVNLYTSTLGFLNKYIHNPNTSDLSLQKQARGVLKYFKDCKKQTNIDYMIAGYNLFLHSDGMVYIIPYGMPGIVTILDETNVLPKYVEDFCYYDNADEPQNITKEEWKERRETWEKVGVFEFVNDNKLTCTVISCDDFNLLDFVVRYARENKK